MDGDKFPNTKHRVELKRRSEFDITLPWEVQLNGDVICGYQDKHEAIEIHRKIEKALSKI